MQTWGRSGSSTRPRSGAAYLTTEAAEAATARALDLARANVPPFDGEAATGWLETARGLAPDISTP